MIEIDKCNIYSGSMNQCKEIVSHRYGVEDSNGKSIYIRCDLHMPSIVRLYHFYSKVLKLTREEAITYLVLND